jgi:hypothetical protein
MIIPQAAALKSFEFPNGKQTRTEKTFTAFGNFL